MGERDDKQLNSPSGSSSARDSSPGALDSASVRDLASALHGLRQDNADLREMLRGQANKGQFREQMVIDAMQKNTAAMKSLTSHIANSLKLNREIVASERQVIEGAAADARKAARRLEETGEHILHREFGSDEITGRHVRAFVSRKLIPWAVKNGVLLKIFGTLAAAAGAAWALLSRLAHKL